MVWMKGKRTTVFGLLLVGVWLVLGCQQPAGKSAETVQDEIIYHVFQRSFMIAMAISMGICAAYNPNWITCKIWV